MNQPKPISVKITRLDVRNRKIIIVIEPDLLSGESFGLANTWTDERIRRQLETAHFQIQIKEKDGKAEGKVWYSGSHYATDHSQLPDITSFYISDEDAAMGWVEKCPPAGLGGDAAKMILSQWEDRPEFRDRLAKAIKDRQERNANEYFQNATEEFKAALDKYQSIVAHRAAVKS